MDFKVVPDRLRDEVRPARHTRSPFVQALLDGKTLQISKEDRKLIGGNTKTLKNNGYKLRSGMIDDNTVVVWAEKLEEEDSN